MSHETFLMCFNLFQDPVVNKSLNCLRESMSDLSNTYTTALMAYVFTLAGDEETRGRLLQHLDMIAESKGEPSSLKTVSLAPIM